ncbi:MAG TPA: FAD-dependent oxidoreductase, partial [Polyangiales bacterium]|nr:FAD-dependent oxidoreductase [Polyangiales bacterium]
MDVLVIGDGPGGLSAALFLAKGGVQVGVYGQDKTAMHWALLKNYLGVPEITGSEFQKIARKQASDFGAKLVDARVDALTKQGSGFEATLEDGQ